MGRKVLLDSVFATAKLKDEINNIMIVPQLP